MLTRYRSLILFMIPMVMGNSAVAQDYPSKLVRFIVPDSAGSTPDLLGRVVAPEISKILGQPVVVENKPGAGQLIGLEYVATQAPADGYTVAVVSMSTIGILPLTVSNLRFDPGKDLPPITIVAEGRLILGTASASPWKTVNELVAAVKANPGKFTYGSPNNIVKLASESFVRGLGLNVVAVPYSSGARYYQALMTEEVNMGMVSTLNTVSMGEKFRVLAATGDQRYAPFLHIPTFSEVGLKQIRGLGYALNVRAGTPKVVIDKLFDASSRSLRGPEIKAKFVNMLLDIVDQPPDVSAKRFADEAKQFADIAKAIGLTPQ